ncbi:MAG TPA: hypothetical protein PKD79_03655 [Candidatus Doudnabacteria bacterium]|nr:hypothetical protein [Candidatus Doudnabacteria bacterium]
MDFANTKKNSEFVWASVFVNYINQAHGTNYEISPELGENSPIDMHLECARCTDQHLDLQLTHAVEVPFVALHEHSAIDYSKQPTMEAIDRKKAKLESQAAKLEEIILIIQGYMSKTQAETVFRDPVFAKYKTYPFAGIYYVSPPMIAGETDEYMQNGVVIPIKDFFNK